MRVKVAYNLHRVMVWNHVVSHGIAAMFLQSKSIDCRAHNMLHVDSRVTAWKNNSGASFREPLTS
jgi:hypothetical protein